MQTHVETNIYAMQGGGYHFHISYSRFPILHVISKDKHIISSYLLKCMPCQVKGDNFIIDTAWNFPLCQCGDAAENYICKVSASLFGPLYMKSWRMHEIDNKKARLSIRLFGLICSRFANHIICLLQTLAIHNLLLRAIPRTLSSAFRFL